MSRKSGASTSALTALAPPVTMSARTRTNGVHPRSSRQHALLTVPTQFSTVATCRKHDVPIDHAARQVSTHDFTTFDYILASDENNLRNLRGMAPKNGKADVRLFGSYNDDKAIPDPYYGGIVGPHPPCLFLRSPTPPAVGLVERFRAGVPAMRALFECVPRRGGRKVVILLISMITLELYEQLVPNDMVYPRRTVRHSSRTAFESSDLDTLT
jgi:hypothetical protein